MRHRYIHTTVATLVAAFALSACGGATDATGRTDDGASTRSELSTDVVTDGSSSVGEAASAGATVDTTATAAAAAPDDEWAESDDEIAIALADGNTSADSTNVAVDGDVVTILASGTYRLSGTLTEGRLVVDALDDGVVRIILDGAVITSSEPGALYVDSAGEVQIWLVGDNALADGGIVTTDADGDEGPNAALYSEADLTIAGDGSLTVTGNVVDGITSKDDLVVAGGRIVVRAVDDGIRGKDNLVIEAGTIDVDAGGDALTSDNEDASDDGNDDVGNIVVAGGILTLTAATDGIDGVGDVSIDGGVLTIVAADDAVHADATLTVSGGSIDVRQSYEGLEGKIVEISGGEISIVSTDDGINVAGGNDASGRRGPGGGQSGDAFADTGDQYGEITGGSIVIYADGDGIDVNGSLSMTGGNIVVNGPTANMNGALDVDGSFQVSGETVLVAAGSAGMAEAPASTSLSLRFQATVSAGAVLEIVDDAGSVLVTFEAAKPFQSFVYASPDVVAGSSYRVVLDGEEIGTVSA